MVIIPSFRAMAIMVIIDENSRNTLEGRASNEATEHSRSYRNCIAREGATRVETLRVQS